MVKLQNDFKGNNGCLDNVRAIYGRRRLYLFEPFGHLSLADEECSVNESLRRVLRGDLVAGGGGTRGGE